MGTPISLSATALVLGQFAVPQSQVTSKDRVLILNAVLEECRSRFKHLYGFSSLGLQIDSAMRRLYATQECEHILPSDADRDTRVISVWNREQTGYGLRENSVIFLTQDARFLRWESTWWKPCRNLVDRINLHAILKGSQFFWMEPSAVVGNDDTIAHSLLKGLIEYLAEITRTAVVEQTTWLEGMKKLNLRLDTIKHRL